MGVIYCRTGHYIELEGLNDGPTAKFCSECGEPAYPRCEGCKGEIQPEDTQPKFCKQCGHKFPWV